MKKCQYYLQINFDYLQFFTWNTDSKKCGLRSYHPTSLINAPTQKTGTRYGGIVAASNKVSWAN